MLVYRGMGSSFIVAERKVVYGTDYQRDGWENSLGSLLKDR